MLKSVLYYLLFLTTAVRFIDMIYLLSKDNTSLPIPVIVVTTAMILYGIVLVVKKFIGAVRLKQLMTFYLVQVGMIAFNMTFVAIFCPLQISVAETFIVGTFLDILVAAVLLYSGLRQMRSRYAPMVQVVGKEQV